MSLTSLNNSTPQLPTFPDISSAQEAPPTETTHVIRTMPVRLKLYAIADNDEGFHDYVDEIESNGDSNPKLVTYWAGSSKPPAYTVECHSYWRVIPGTTYILHSGDTFKRACSVTHGISTTDSTEISVEVGAEGGGFSASLAASFGHSVTVTTEETVTTEITAGPVPENKICVISLYQLIDEIRVVGSDGNLLNYAARGDVDFTNDEHYSGAYLALKKVNQIFPAGTTFLLEKNFSAV